VRAVAQRVRSASVRVEGAVVGAVGEGLLVYVGVGQGDTAADAAYLAQKVAGLRVFPDERLPMNRAVTETGGGVLVISQFTLFGDCRKGRRPSFNEAMEPGRAAELIEAFRSGLEAQGLRTAEGVFGAMMDVESVNWGPVTILLDSKKIF
jgi:D-tyrosyl-tRNA(Tyr) deacylase